MPLLFVVLIGQFLCIAVFLDFLLVLLNLTKAVNVGDAEVAFADHDLLVDLPLLLLLVVFCHDSGEHFVRCHGREILHVELWLVLFFLHDRGIIFVWLLLVLGFGCLVAVIRVDVAGKVYVKFGVRLQFVFLHD